MSFQLPENLRDTTANLPIELFLQTRSDYLHKITWQKRSDDPALLELHYLLFGNKEAPTGVEYSIANFRDGCEKLAQRDFYRTGSLLQRTTSEILSWFSKEFRPGVIQVMASVNRPLFEEEQNKILESDYTPDRPIGGLTIVDPGDRRGFLGPKVAPSEIILTQNKEKLALLHQLALVDTQERQTKQIESPEALTRAFLAEIYNPLTPLGSAYQLTLEVLKHTQTEESIDKAMHIVCGRYSLPSDRGAYPLEEDTLAWIVATVVKTMRSLVQDNFSPELLKDLALIQSEDLRLSQLIYPTDPVNF